MKLGRMKDWRSCHYCGEVFRPNNGNQVYCTIACKNGAVAQAKNNPDDFIRVRRKNVMLMSVRDVITGVYSLRPDLADVLLILLDESDVWWQNMIDAGRNEFKTEPTLAWWIEKIEEIWASSFVVEPEKEKPMLLVVK